VGLATIADVLQAKTALSQAQLSLESTQGQLQTMRGALALSMGLPANVPYDLGLPADTAIPLGVTDSVDTLIERAVRERPDLAAQRAQVALARARVSVARSQALPSLSVGGNTGETQFLNTAIFGNSYTATVTLSIPVFSGGAQIYNIKAAAAAAEAALERARGFEQQVVFQVFNAYYALRTATQQVRTSTDLLASATQSEQVALGRYKAGAGSLLDLLTAQAALASARAQSIGARFSWYIALAQLAHDVGILGLDGASPLHRESDSTGVRK
jgi:outer membrane protein TolC